MIVKYELKDHSLNQTWILFKHYLIIIVIITAIDYLLGYSSKTWINFIFDLLQINLNSSLVKNQTKTGEAKCFKLQIHSVVFSWKTLFANHKNSLTGSICSSLFKLDYYFKINFVRNSLSDGFPR